MCIFHVLSCTLKLQRSDNCFVAVEEVVSIPIEELNFQRTCRALGINPVYSKYVIDKDPALQISEMEDELVWVSQVILTNHYLAGV